MAAHFQRKRSLIPDVFNIFDRQQHQQASNPILIAVTHEFDAVTAQKVR